MSFAHVGKIWTAETFAEHLKGETLAWADSVTIHHTAIPDLSMRKKGFLENHMKWTAEFYQGKGWNSGPHLFIDHDECHGMTPLSETGIHAKSFNSHSIGIEVLGNYDKEDPKTGGGAKCWLTAARATAAILKRLGLDPSEKNILFHRDDPRTSKSCPGVLVKKGWFVNLVLQVWNEKRPAEEPEEVSNFDRIEHQVEKLRDSLEFENEDQNEDQKEEVEFRLDSILWSARKISNSD
jgi:hypothetical protein